VTWGKLRPPQDNAAERLYARPKCGGAKGGAVAGIEVGDLVETQENGWFSWGVFLACCLVMLADGYNNQVINYAAPTIVREWGIARADMGPVFTIGLFGWMLGAIGFSMLADRVGRRAAIIAALALFGAFTLVTPVAGDLMTLTVLRFAASLGVGGAVPMAIALTSEYSRGATRGLRIAALFVGYTVGSFGGGQFAAAAIPAYGWPVIFYLGGAGALAIALLLLAVLPESIRFLLVHGRGVSQVLAIARRLKPSAGFTADSRFVIAETANRGVPFLHLFTEGRATLTIYLWLALGFAFVTHFFVSSWLPTILVNGTITESDSVDVASWFQLGAWPGSLMAGWLLDKRGINALTILMLLGAVPTALIGLPGLGVTALKLLALVSGVFVLGGGIGINALSGIVYPTFIRSTGTGASFGAARIGAMIGPAIGAALIAAGEPLPVIFAAAALPMLAAAAASFLLNRTVAAPAEADAAPVPIR
jgi:AAHS family 4-hydroxybenzoate transporter-like MFS transporter